MSNNEDKSGSFYSMHKLCGELEKESTHSGKTKLISTFIKVFKGDIYLLAKLMLCKEDKRVFRIKDKAMLKICAHIWDCDLDDMIADLDNGDFTETCRKFYMEYGKFPEKSTITLKEVDGVLDSLTLSGKFDDQVKIISKILKRCTPLDFRLICRIIDSDLKVNTGAKFFLDALHPHAYDAFKKANNLKDVIEKIRKHDLDNEDEDNEDNDGANEDEGDEDSGDEGGGSKKKSKGKGKKSLEVSIKLMTPVKPMLPKAVKSVEGVVSSSQCFYAEIKYDGERIQIHKNGNQFSCFSRNLKPLMPWKVDEVKPYIPKATKAQQMILDGEILLMDTKTSLPLPFGTLSVHKKNGFVDATVCVFLFDILYLNGKSLIHLPLKERREILEKNVSVVKNRIEFSEVTIVNGVAEKSKLTQLLNRAFREKLEGLVIKDAISEYEPGCRHWIKIKKDYIKGMADSADLIAVGGYYGSGSSGGLVTVFLMVCYDKANKVYKTVVKASGGLDDNAIAKLQPKVKETMVKVSKDMSKMPNWLDLHKQYAPDFVVKDIKQAMVFEIESAEFTKSDHHTTGYSMRFPRILRIRKDKDYKTATNLEELMDIGKDIKIVPYGSGKVTSTTTSTTTTTTTTKPVKKTQLTDDENDGGDDVKIMKQSESKLIFVNGDITKPFMDSGDEGSKTFILNYVDNSGIWNEKGLSGVICKKWPSIPKAFDESIVKSGEIRVEKVAKDELGEENNIGKKIFVCNVSCIIPPKSKKESYSFSLKEFKPAIKEAKGAINQHKASVHLIKPYFTSPSWSDIDEILSKELADSGIKVYVHSIKSNSPPINSTKITTTTTASTINLKTTTTATSKISPLKRNREEEEEEEEEDVDKLEHDLIKDIEPSEPIFEGLNIVIDSKTVKEADRKRLERSIKILGGSISEKWQQFGANKTTHLICNGMSDLYLHVDRLGGTIVLPNYIDQCFGSDKLLPLHDDYLFFCKDNHPDYSLSLDNSTTNVNNTIKQEDQELDVTIEDVEVEQLKDDEKLIKKSKTTTITATASISTSSSGSSRPTKKQHLSTIFEECNIFLHDNVNDKETLKRYIIAYGGDISEQINENTTHLVASLPQNFSSVKSKDLFKNITNINSIIVNSLWLWDSINMGVVSNDLLDVKGYKLF